MARARATESAGQSFAICDSDSTGRMIDFRGSDGTRYALAYTDLKTVELTTDLTLVLEFVNHHVIIRGRNLTPVYDALVGQTVLYIQENEVDWAREAETFVESLAIVPKSA